MGRRGVRKYVDVQNPVDYLGENTVFRKLCSGLVSAVVKQGKWFSFHTRAHNDQIDILRIQNDDGVTLGRLLAQSSPYDGLYKTSVYKCLLRDYLCYLEYPIVKRNFSQGGSTNSFEKLLVTSNIRVVAKWMGISEEEAEKQYESVLGYVDSDDGTSLFSYVKLYEDKSGVRKVTRPRKKLDLSILGLRIVPLFALEVGVDCLYGMLSKDTYNVTFVKDSGQERTINTCFSREIISEYYVADTFYFRGISEMYAGSFQDNPNLGRGYIRVFELGSSIYDSPTRSINYARIISFEKGAPNMAFSHIDLSTAMPVFEKYIYRTSPSEIEDIVDGLVDSEVGVIGSLDSVSMNPTSLVTWAKNQEVLLSTVFLRQLALFLILYSGYFGGYTGSLEDASSNFHSDTTFVGLDFE